MAVEVALFSTGDVVAGRYAIEGSLGAGGMGIVYRARHQGTERECAIKLLHQHLAQHQKLKTVLLVAGAASGRGDEEQIGLPVVLFPSIVAGGGGIAVSGTF